MIENVIGRYSLPIGVATNFIIDGDHYVIPFVVEEPVLLQPLQTWPRDVRRMVALSQTIQTQS